MPLGQPKDLIECQRFFLEPASPRQRMYEALRSYFVEGRSSQEVAQAFGYTPASFRVLCHQFRRDPDPQFFLTPTHGPQRQPKKSAVRAIIERLRKQNYSIYEISEQLKAQGRALSPTAVREVLKELGFAALPRRGDDERPSRARPTVEAVTDARAFSLAPQRFSTPCGGLFLFLPDLVSMQLTSVAHQARLPGSKMIPAEPALRACLALKLWSIERKSHVMARVADPGLALFCGLNVIPKKSYFAEYSSRIASAKTTQLLALWHEQLLGQPPLAEPSFDLDFHSIPHYGEDALIERHYVSARSRRQPSVLTFLAHDAQERAFCYANADIRKGEESEEVFRFLQFWKQLRGDYPRHLVFDSRLTTQPNLARLDQMGITFITLRRRNPAVISPGNSRTTGIF